MPRLDTKAAYRIFSNSHVDEKQILHGHFQSTKDRFSKSNDPILISHDTTTFSYQREKPELIGITHLLRNGNIYSKSKAHTQCGI